MTHRASEVSRTMFVGMKQKWLAAVAAVCLGALVAEAASPSLGTILPRGGQRGTEVEVTFSGGSLADAEGLLLEEHGISLVEMTPAEDGKSAKAKLALAPDAPLGPQGVRVRTRTGVTNMVMFSIGNLTEISEPEPNGTAEEAQEVAVGTTVNGVVTSEDVDYYAVNLEAGARLAVEVEALRLGGTLFDPKLRLFSPKGHELIAEDDTQLLRQDAAFVHTAEEAGRYLVAISEASYGGNGSSYYRLHLGAFPRPLSVVPLGGPAGQTVEVTWLGDPGVASQQVVVPAMAGPGLGTNAALLGTTGSISVAAETGIAPTDIPFRVSDLANFVEAEPNNEFGAATPGEVPGAFQGVISEPGDQDFFQFEGKKDQVYDFRVWAREMGSPLDSVLRIKKPDGGEVTASDDSAGLDSSVRATLPEDGTYRIEVYDHLVRGGESFGYRVEVTPVLPSYTFGLIDNRSGTLTVPQGNQSYILVNLRRRDFGEAVRLTLDGLPEGLHAEPVVFDKAETTRPVVITATAETPVGGSMVRLMGVQEGVENGLTGQLDHEIRLVNGNNDTTFYGIQTDRLAVAAAEPSPFKVSIVPPQAPMVHSGRRNLTVQVERAEGFTGEVVLDFPWLPTGLGGGSAKVPGEQTSGEVSFEVRGETPVGTHNIFVRARSAGWEIVSPWCPIEVQEPWFTFQLAEMETEQGKGLSYAVTVNQRQAFEGEFNVELAGLPNGVTTEALPMTKDTAELVFPLTVAADAKVGKHQSITARTTIVYQDEPVYHVNGGGKLKVYEPLPEELQAKAPPPEEKKEEAEEEKRKTRFPTS
jgi:hypothetical protein